jgi:serine phosphatase RsbU (regulator of sigma subunit)
MLSISGLAHALSGRRARRPDNELLAAAGAVFDSSLDHRQTMRTIAQTAVPRLADLCIIDLVRDDGFIGDTVAVSIDGDAGARLERIRGAQPLDPAGEHPVASALRSREAVVIEDLADPALIEKVAQSEEHRQFIAWAGYRSGVVMPLQARDRLLGALSFLYVGEERRFDQEDLPLMRDIAARAAMALDNAKLYEERAQVAQTLQRSLLPDTLPRVEGLALASAYHPALDRDEVGGDFYDVFHAPSGCWLVVGDVCGKGTDAAAVTALVRHSVRALAFVWPSPAKVLGAVNEVMLGHRLAGRFATAVVARLELRGVSARATIAAAGHPEPLLLEKRDRARPVASHGMLLGVMGGRIAEDVEVEMAAGATLVLYTDGLLDAGAPARGTTPRELCERLERGERSPAEVIAALERLALVNGGGSLRDDVAIVAAQVPEGAADSINQMFA